MSIYFAQALGRSYARRRPHPAPPDPEPLPARGVPRAHCHGLFDALNDFSAEALSGIQERVTRSFSNEGIITV